MILDTIKITINGNIEEINKAIDSAQEAIWRWMIRVYKNGMTDNKKLIKSLEDNVEFAEWFFNDGNRRGFDE